MTNKQYQPPNYYYNQYYNNDIFLYNTIHKKRLDTILENIIKYSTAKNVIDIGCGSGILLQLLYENGFSVTGVDIIEEQMKYAQSLSPKGNFITQNIIDLKLEEKFDVVISTEVLEHFDKDNQIKLMHNFDTLLKEEGTLVFSMPSWFYIKMEILWKPIRSMIFSNTEFNDEEIHHIININKCINFFTKRGYTLLKKSNIMQLVNYAVLKKPNQTL